MNQRILDINYEGLRANNLADVLLSHGIASATTEEIAYLLDIPTDHVRQRMALQRQRGSFVSPARGLWVPVFAEERSMAAPQPPQYLNELMHYLNTSYCVGWLTAAAYLGASHQAAQYYQVATSRKIANRAVGLTRFEFKARAYLDKVLIHTLRLSTGTIAVASAGTTMLMLTSDVDLASGINNAATAIVELAEENDGWLDEVEHDIEFFPVSATRRIGWILEKFGNTPSLDALARSARTRSSSVSMVSPQSKRGGHVNQRWNLEINKEVDPDL